MAPTPLQKTPQISPIFISDKVTLHVSREKDGKLRFVYAGWDDAKVVQPDGPSRARCVRTTYHATSVQSSRSEVSGSHHRPFAVLNKHVV